MLYTFELTETQLTRVTDYLDGTYLERPREYIMGVQHRITDDLVWVIIECSPETATFIHLIS